MTLQIKTTKSLSRTSCQIFLSICRNSHFTGNDQAI